MDSPERVFTAEVEASAPPTLARNEGSTRIDIPLGTGAALACFVYERPIDAAGAMLAVANAVRGGPGVTVRRMEPTEVLRIAGAPALFLHVDYETATPGGTGAGQMKLMVSASPELPLLCAHDEPGYTRTFRRITTGLATSLQVPGRARKPAPREELHVLKLDGRLAGFKWRASRSAPDGPTRTESITSLLLPDGAGGLRAEDTTTTTLTDEQDHLKELRHARAENGTLALQVTLRRERKAAPGAAPSATKPSTAASAPATKAPAPSTGTSAPATEASTPTTGAPRAAPVPSSPEDLTVPGTTYRYEGRQGTRVLKGTFTSKRGLATEDDASLILRRWLLPGLRPEVVLDVYRPADDPTAPVELLLRRDTSAGAGPRAFTLTVGASTAKARANTQGQVEWVELPLPLGRLTFELLHASP
ncbi:hypothetical protein ACLESO_18365 [Pyxidicoccus sp. 3LG]